MDIDCPKPTRIACRNLIGNRVTIRAILTVTASEFFEDDVPVGRCRRYILLGLQ